MATKQVRAQANTCDYDDCQHQWVTVDVPERCARCKRRRWNKGGFTHPDTRQTRQHVSEREESASKSKRRAA